MGSYNMTKAVILSSTKELKQDFDPDLTSIAALTGTSGLLRKTAANTWALDTSDYSETANRLATPRKINDATFDGSADVVVSTIYDSNFTRITNPVGGRYVTSSNVVTGAITIVLPVGMTSTMMRMTVKVFNYNTNTAFEIHCGGYNYSAGGGWVNTFAYILGNPNTDIRKTVRFGKNAAGKAVVYIGELASAWSYPQVFVTEAQLGYSGYGSSWAANWDIVFTTAAFENVTATISDCQVGYATSTNVAGADVRRDASGNFAANVITVSGGFNSSNIFSFLNSGAAQGIKVGSLVIDSTYATSAPTNGLYVKGVLQSGVTTGTAPLLIASTTRVANLNVETAGVADTATKLTTARTINGVSFDGSANVTGDVQMGAGKISFSTANPDICLINVSGRIAAGSAAAQGFNASSLLISSAWADATLVPTNGIYSKGQISSGAATGVAPFLVTSTTRVANLNVASAGNADTATNVAYSGLTGTVPTWNQNTTGNAGTATVLQTARTINGVSFNGSANISISAASPYTLTAGSYLTGSSYNGSAAVTFAVDATNAATANKIVARDASGNTAVNELASTAIKLNSIVTNSTATVTTATVSQTALLQLAIATYAGTKIVIQATSAGQRHITELLVLHNGTVASSTEYGSILTGASLFSTDVDISSGSMRILVTSATATSTVYKASYTAITI